LKSERKIIRLNHDGSLREQVRPGLNKSGLHNHMRDLRLLFNACRNYYNDEDLGIIRVKHYPFKKYKVGTAPKSEPRALTIEQILSILQYKPEPESRAELAKDLFLLSFYLCGMNAADMYELTKGVHKLERLEYKRAKTRNKRKDEAFISIKIIKQSVPLLKKYAGKLQYRYSTTAGLNTAIDKGITEISKAVGF